MQFKTFVRHFKAPTAPQKKAPFIGIGIRIPVPDPDPASISTGIPIPIPKPISTGPQP